MAAVKIKITEYTDDSQPGWVRCVLTDVYGKEWYFEEKVPNVSDVYLDENSVYPQDGIIKCLIVKEDEENGYVDIDTSKPIGIYSEEDKTHFTVFKEQLVNA